MSATNRGAERHDRDFYPTPSWCVHRLLEKKRLPGGPWLEPCVGDGAIVRAVNAVRSDVQWTTMDIRPETGAMIIGDFTDPSVELGGSFNVALTNPSFAIALLCAKRALQLAVVVAFLERINWLRGPDAHNAWLRENTPSLYVLPQRPSFDGRGTDATEYAWFVWDPTEAPRVVILDDTPDSIRASHNQEMRRREFAVGSLFDAATTGAPQLDLLGGDR